MGLTDKMSQFSGQVQTGIKTSFTGLVLFLFKVISGLAVGLTVALASQEAFGFGGFSLGLILVVITGLFLRVAKDWGFAFVLVFDLICCLVAMLIRMYLLMAP